MRAVILEVEGRRAVVLAADGSFRRVRAPGGAMVGDAIDLPAGGRWRLPRPAAVALAACLLLAVVIPTALWQARPAEAYVMSLDLGASLELAIDGDGRFLDVVGADAAAAPLAAELRALRGRPVDEVVAAAARAAVDRGWLGGHGGPVEAVVLVVTTAGPEQAPHAGAAADDLRRRARERVAAELARTRPQAPAAVASGLVDPAVRKVAAERGLTVARAVEVLAEHYGVPVDEVLGRLSQAKDLDEVVGLLKRLPAGANVEQDERDGPDGKDGKGRKGGKGEQGDGEGARPSRRGRGSATPAAGTDDRREDGRADGGGVRDQDEGRGRDAKEKDRGRERVEAGEEDARDGSPAIELPVELPVQLPGGDGEQGKPRRGRRGD